MYVPCEYMNVVGNGDKGGCVVIDHHDVYTFSFENPSSNSSSS